MEPLTPLALGLIAAAVAIPLGLSWLVMWQDTRRLLHDFDTRDRAFGQRQALHEMAWQIRDEIAKARRSDVERFHDSLTRRRRAASRPGTARRHRTEVERRWVGRAVQPSRRYGRDVLHRLADLHQRCRTGLRVSCRFPVLGPAVSLVMVTDIAQ